MATAKTRCVIRRLSPLAELPRRQNKEKVRKMTQPKIYTQYTRPEHEGVTYDPEDTTVQQNQAEACDINNIVNTFHRTGLLSHVVSEPPKYQDNDGKSFTEAMLQVKAVEGMFSELPSDVRQHFDNDPVKFLDAYEDDDQTDYLIENGLIEKPELGEPGEPETTPPAPEAPALEPESA
ncbi:internal scaffolding protein [Microviridae sp.]|nr:internal scaffolding protein [Microviridae sp.]